ncbi:MAG: NusG domain II-containing protein [Romboutsia sp.]
MKTLKKLDVVIIVLLVVLSFTPHFIFAKTWSKDYTSTYANIKISGKTCNNIPLSSFKGEDKFVIETSHGNNTIIVKNNTIQIIEADCHDELCVKQGDIFKIGESIICLPHELIIEIKGEESIDSSDDILLSY